MGRGNGGDLGKGKSDGAQRKKGKGEGGECNMKEQD